MSIMTSKTKIYTKLDQNENPWGPAPAVIETIQRLAPLMARYAPNEDTGLREALSYRYDLPADHFVVGNGARDILGLIGSAFLQPGDEAIYCPPTFFLYKKTIEMAGAIPVEVPLQTSDYTVDVDAVLDAVTEKTRILYLCNPNNPTGSILTDVEFERLLAHLPSEVLVVYDEVYHHFVTDRHFPHGQAYLHRRENMIVLHSFAKAYGLAGLMMGYGIAAPSIIQRLAPLKQPRRFSLVAYHATLAALEETKYLAETIEAMVESRQWLHQELEAMGWQVWASQGSFVMFEPPCPRDDVMEALHSHGVLIRKAFGTPNCLRVSVGTPTDNQRFIAALHAIFSVSHLMSDSYQHSNSYTNGAYSNGGYSNGSYSNRAYANGTYAKVTYR